MNILIESIIQNLKSAGVIDGSSVKGCDDNDIKALEDYYTLKLPDNYKKFLKILGKNSGGFLDGSDFIYQKLFKLKEHAVDLLKENKADYILEKEDFVFISHQGYQFLFFKCDEKDNSIYYYEDGEVSIRKVYESFDQWLSDTAADEIEARNSLSSSTKS